MLAARQRAGFVLAAIAVLVGLAFWQRNGYWDYSDGVYAATAREVLNGARLYHGVAAAQPPLVYLVGAALLGLHDGLASIRAGMALADLATATLVALATWRLVGRRWPALVAGLLALLTPWALHEHAQLTPETLAAPLLLGAAGLAARPNAPVGSGVLGALAIGCKLAFGLPALAIALAAAARTRALAALVGATALLAALGTAVFGTAMWRQAVKAQTQVGSHSLHYVGGLWAQAAWGLAPLGAGVLAALVLRRRAAEPRLLVTVTAAGAAGLLLLLTLYKNGSYLNVVQVAEPPLLVLGAAGVAWLLDAARERAPHARPALVLAAVLAALGVAQVASLLIEPGNPRVFARPRSATAPGETLSPANVDRAVAQTRACPADTAYSGPPYLAFLARRRMPGHQPDQFIIANAREDAAFARRAAADARRCP